MMDEKWAFITGSNRGIGEAAAEKFLTAGYHIYAHCRCHTEEFEQKMNAWKTKYGREVKEICFDLTDSEAMKTAMKELIKAKQQIDVLVNNGGVTHTGLFQLTDMQTIREVFDVNLFGTMELTQYVIKLMQKKKRGSIVNISSITGEDLGIGQCAYGVSKAAVAAFTKTLAAEMRNYGIRVNAVAPGMVYTRMTESEEMSAAKTGIENGKGPFGRLAEPQEIAEAVYYLGSEASGYVTGQVLRVDGGNRL